MKLQELHQKYYGVEDAFFKNTPNVYTNKDTILNTFEYTKSEKIRIPLSIKNDILGNKSIITIDHRDKGFDFFDNLVLETGPEFNFNSKILFRCGNTYIDNLADLKFQLKNLSRLGIIKEYHFDAKDGYTIPLPFLTKYNMFWGRDFYHDFEITISPALRKLDNISLFVDTYTLDNVTDQDYSIVTHGKYWLTKFPKVEMINYTSNFDISNSNEIRLSFHGPIAALIIQVGCLDNITNVKLRFEDYNYYDGPAVENKVLKWIDKDTLMFQFVECFDNYSNTSINFSRMDRAYLTFTCLDGKHIKHVKVHAIGINAIVMSHGMFYNSHFKYIENKTPDKYIDQDAQKYNYLNGGSTTILGKLSSLFGY